MAGRFHVSSLDFDIVLLVGSVHVTSAFTQYITVDVRPSVREGAGPHGVCYARAARAYNGAEPIWGVFGQNPSKSRGPQIL